MSSFFYNCPGCRSERVESGADVVAGPNGPRFMTCTKCRWRGYVETSALSVDEAPKSQSPAAVPGLAARAS
ncbi:MAG: hypothetical protein ACYC6M_03805 [Terriglobales bacterium]